MLAICGDRAVLAHIAGPLGEAARDAAGSISAKSPDNRRMLRARLAAAVRAPVPAGIRGVDPSWIEAGLVGLPARARTAIATNATTQVDVWLARWACAEIPPLPAASATTVQSIDDAIRLPGERLVAWLGAVGFDQLAFALRAAGPEAFEVAARVLGSNLMTAAGRIDEPPRAGALGPVRAAITRCRVELGPIAVVRIGARTIAPHVHALARRQLAVRLPRSLGLVVHGELVAHARTAVDQCPTWLALAASCSQPRASVDGE